MKKKRGQAAFEYIILLGALLVILMPLLYYVGVYSAQEIKMKQAQDAVKTIEKTADAIYALGPGNKAYVWITMPGSILETSLSNNEVLIRMFLFGDYTDIYTTTIGNLTGSLPTEKGTYKISLEVLDNGIIKIE